MIINGKKAHSRGQEEVSVYGERQRRAVYCIDDAWEFYIKIDGEYIEVFHYSSSFGTTPDSFHDLKSSSNIKKTDQIFLAAMGNKPEWRRVYRHEPSGDLYISYNNRVVNVTRRDKSLFQTEKGAVR